MIIALVSKNCYQKVIPTARQDSFAGQEANEVSEVPVVYPAGQSLLLLTTPFIPLLTKEGAVGRLFVKS